MSRLYRAKREPGKTRRTMHRAQPENGKPVDSPDYLDLYWPMIALNNN